jgi:hypothetical protein
VQGRDVSTPLEMTRMRGGLRDKRGRRRTKGCCRNSSGRCGLSRCMDWSEHRCSGRSGCCYRASCWRRSEGCCGSRSGGCCDARDGRSSGGRCSAGNRRCCGAIGGGWCEVRSSGRSRGMSDRCARRRGSVCCGCMSGRSIGGKDSPSRPGDGRNSDNAEVRMQTPEVRTPGRRRAWNTPWGRSQRLDVRWQKSEVRSTECHGAMLRLGVAASLIPVRGAVLRIRNQITGATGRCRRCEMSDERRQMAVAANPACAAFRCHVICRTARISRNRAGKSRKLRKSVRGPLAPQLGQCLAP